MSVQDFSFNGAGSPANDGLIQKQYPGILLNGTEPLGEWSEVREINGALWQTLNANWSPALQNWIQVNPQVASQAISLSAAGILTLYSAAAGVTPFAWTSAGNVITGNPVLLSPAAAQTGNINITGSIEAGPGGLNPQWFNVLDYALAAGKPHASTALGAPVTMVAPGASVSVTLATALALANGDAITVADYNYCFSGTVTAGAGTTSITLTVVTNFVGTVGNIVTSGGNSSATRDMYAGIAAAMAAAIAVGTAAHATTPTLYFPPGIYPVSQTIAANPAVSILTAGTSELLPCGSVTNCISYLGGEGADQFAQSYINLPSIIYFKNGAGLYFSDSGSGCSNATFTINTIRGCNAAIQFDATTNGVSGMFNNTINTVYIEGNTYGILIRSLGGSRDNLQGIRLTGFLIGNLYSVYFQATYVKTTTGFVIPGIGSSVSVPISSAGYTNGDYVFVRSANTAYYMIGLVQAGGGTSTLTVLETQGSGTGNNVGAGAQVMPYMGAFGNHVFDLHGSNGNASTTYGVVIDGMVMNSSYLRGDSSWGAFGTGQYVSSVNGGFCAGWTFEVSFYPGPGPLDPGYSAFTALVSPSSNFLSSNIFRVLSPQITGFTGAAGPNVVPQTAGGNRTAFNTANGTQYGNRFPVTFTVGALAAGGTADYYVYSPYTFGCNGQTTCVLDSGTIPVVVQLVADETYSAANQIRIRLIALAATGGGTVTGMVTVGL